MDLGGINRGRGERNICGALPISSDFSGLSSGGVPRDVPHVGQDMGKFYVQALEGPSGDPTVGPVPLSIFSKLLHSNAFGEVDTEPKDRQEMEMRLQRRDVEIDQREGEMMLSLYDQEEDPFVEGAKIFQYRVRTLEQK